MTSRTVWSVTMLATAILLLSSASETAASGAGIKFGLAFAKQNYSYADANLQFNNDYRRGFSAGLFLEQSLMPFVAVRAEGLYIPKGFKVSAMVTDYAGVQTPRTVDFNYRIDYLSLNLVGKVSLPSKTYLLAGPRLDIKLNTRDDSPALIPAALEDKFSKTVFGWTFGIGQEMPLAPKLALFVEGQLYADQGNLYDYTAQGTDKIGTLETIRNKSYALFAGLRF